MAGATASGGRERDRYALLSLHFIPVSIETSSDDTFFSMPIDIDRCQQLPVCTVLYFSSIIIV